MFNPARRPTTGLIGRPDPICQFQLVFQCLVVDHSTMERLRDIGRPTNYIGHANQFFWVVGRFIPLIVVIHRLVEPTLKGPVPWVDESLKKSGPRKRFGQ